MKKTSTFSAVAAILTLSLALSACSSLDVVGKASVASLEQVLEALPEKVKVDEQNAGWSLGAPDDSVRFIWSEDYSKSPLHDVMLELDAQPFLDAGLDPEKLPENYSFYEGEAMGNMGTQMLMVGRKLGGDDKVSGTSTALAAYELIIDTYRDSLNYHTSMDHYGVMLGDGNMFEWAKDMTTNSYDESNQDKDIVFVLNPEPLINAGVNPEQVEDWVYTQVPVEQDGKMVDVWKFLKPFDLK